MCSKENEKDSKNTSHPMDSEVVPVSVPLPASPPGSAGASASAAAAMPGNVSNGDICLLIERLVDMIEKCRPKLEN